MRRIYLIVVIGLIGSYLSAQTLAERLGYKKDDVLLIINNDDSGMSHASNRGTMKGMDEGLLTSSTIMFNCDWSPEIVKYALENPHRNFGVHLTLTSEWKGYKWGTVAPAADVPSLLDENGKLWAGVLDVYAHADPEHAYVEGKAQIQRALDYGLDITHIDSHMGTFQLHPSYIEKYVQLALDFNVPLRMASQSTHVKYGMGDLRKECEDKGLVFPDYMIYEELQNYKGDVEAFWVDIIRNLKAGVTEFYLHASEESDEIKAITNSWKTRAEELRVITESHAIKKALKDKNVHLISYRELRELQRKQNK